MRPIHSLLLMLLCAVLCPAQTGTSGSAAQDETVAMSVEVVKLFTAGKFTEARSKAKSVIEIREVKLGKNHLSLAGSWRNLAYIEAELKDMKAAESAFDRTLEVLEANLPLNAKDETMFAEVLEAAAYFDVGNNTLGKSEARLTRAVEIRERLEGKNSERLANPLRTIGQLHHAKGDYEKAVPFLVRALELRYNKAGTLENNDTIIRETAACSLRKQDKADEAKELVNRFRSSTMGAPGIPKDDTISAGVVNGKALQLAKPAYPREARSKRASGAVSVQVLISEEGAVVFACALSGDKALQGASEVAAYQSKFSPTILRGKPVKVSGVITYNFVP